MGFRFPARKLSELVTFFLLLCLQHNKTFTIFVCGRLLWLWGWLTTTKTLMDTFSAVRFLLSIQKPSFHLSFLWCLRSESQRAEGWRHQTTLEQEEILSRTPNPSAGLLRSFFFFSAGHPKLVISPLGNQETVLAQSHEHSWRLNSFFTLWIVVEASVRWGQI